MVGIVVTLLGLASFEKVMLKLKRAVPGAIKGLVMTTDVLAANGVMGPRLILAAVGAPRLYPPESTAPLMPVSLTVQVSPTTKPLIVPVAPAVKLVVLVPLIEQTAWTLIDGWTVTLLGLVSLE